MGWVERGVLGPVRLPDGVYLTICCRSLMIARTRVLGIDMRHADRLLQPAVNDLLGFPSGL